MSTTGPVESGGFAGRGVASPQASADGPAFDLDEALAEIPGGLETAQELASLYVEEYGCVSARMRRGMAEGDADAVRRGAHVLKSSSAIFAAHAAVDAASRLERLAADGNLVAAEAALAELEREADRLMATLHECFGAAG